MGSSFATWTTHWRVISMLSQLEQTADCRPELSTDDGCRSSGSYGWRARLPRSGLVQFLLCRALHKRKSWLFAGSDRGGERAAAMYSLIATASLNNVDPRAWLADVLARIADHPASLLHELLPWNWSRLQTAAHAA